MFILTRKVGQIIKIGDDITVTIVDVEGNEPTVEISAPRHLSVKREAVYYRLKNLRAKELSEVAAGTLIC